MSLVVDASLVVAALIDGGPDGRWAESVLLSEPLAAPQLMPVEAANILRRAALAGERLHSPTPTCSHSWSSCSPTRWWRHGFGSCAPT